MEKNNYQNQEQERRILWLENHWSTFNDELGVVKTKIGKIETNVNWLMKSYWVIAGASIGALITALINLLVE